MKEFNKLYNEKQNYIKEKQIIEQELNKKEQELANNKKIINDLNIKIKSLKDDDKLMEEIEVYKIPQGVRKKNYKARTFVLEDLKKDNLPEYNEKSNRLKNLEKEYNEKSSRLENVEKEYQNAKEEKYKILKKINLLVSQKLKTRF